MVVMLTLTFALQVLTAVPNLMAQFIVLMWSVNLYQLHVNPLLEWFVHSQLMEKNKCAVKHLLDINAPPKTIAIVMDNA